MPEKEEDHSLPIRVLQLYKEWYDEVWELTFMLNRNPEFEGSEDLGDWTSTIETLMSFGPNPKLFEHRLP